MDLANRPGVWRRAGQTGTPCGLDWGQITPLIPEGVDRNRVLALLKQYEGGLLEGASETARRQAAKAKAEAAASGR